MHMSKIYNDFLTGLHFGRETYVTFRKSDGSIRDMRCSLGDAGVGYDKYARVFDLDKQEYRTVKAESILTVGW
jgi:hypothetical protein